METEKGLVTDFCVAYELTVAGVRYQPCRIDNAHGQVHMDILDTEGDKVGREELGYVEPRAMVVSARDYIETKIKLHRLRILRELGLGAAEIEGGP